MQDKIVVVTGGTGGLGKNVAKAFSRKGAHTIVTYRKNDEFENLRREARNIEGIMADVTDGDNVKAAIDEIIEKYGRIDVLVNLVGGFREKGLLETDEEDFNSMININLRSVFLSSKYVLPHMKKQGGGKIVNVGARSAVEPSAGLGAYAPSKAGVIALTKTLAEEFKHDRINVNCVLPSVIDTEANRRAMPGENFAKWVAPDDIATVILFLASDHAKAVHGAAIPVYGLL
ncbi:MAG: SDR family oxidoreductase [Candidatus Aenigmarchaeota archaeon]|nr:SDR family oxidoreductase [Candidatus Aenigmarchaeota archaeon]